MCQLHRQVCGGGGVEPPSPMAGYPAGRPSCCIWGSLRRCGQCRPPHRCTGEVSPPDKPLA
eukprot:3179836-Lingulodinium_polyedra.AAC.1